MLAKKNNQDQFTFFSTFEEQLNKSHSLYKLAKKIDWKKFDEAFKKYYSETMGRPAKPIRLMVGLLLLKHLRNLSDESVVEQWQENSYYQYFCGEEKFVTSAPCEATELVHFRNRIGEAGMELILQESIRIAQEKHNKKKEKEVIIDTTVQEKNITFPTDDKLHKKIIEKCISIADKEEIELRQRYSRTIKKLSYKQRFKRSKKQSAIARKAEKKIKTIAGRLVREIERKTSPSQQKKYSTEIELYKRVLQQKKDSKNKVYSLHEPETECISKGKAHKKYEFGKKVSMIIGKRSGIILGIKTIKKNDYDGHTLPEALKQFEQINGYNPTRAIVDLGYRGEKKIGKTEIITPTSGKNESQYKRKKMREDHRRRASIEGKISHVKHDYRMGRNYYKGIMGDIINPLLSAAASNLKIWINQNNKKIILFLNYLLQRIKAIFCLEHFYFLGKHSLKLAF